MVAFFLNRGGHFSLSEFPCYAERRTQEMKEIAICFLPSFTGVEDRFFKKKIKEYGMEL